MKFCFLLLILSVLLIWGRNGTFSAVRALCNKLWLNDN